jgi:sarcosine oxidase delta subunit
MNIQCPNCGKVLYHENMMPEDNGTIETACWSDEDGCGEFIVLTKEPRWGMVRRDKENA